MASLIATFANFATPAQTRKARTSAKWSNPFRLPRVSEWRRRLRERNELASLGHRELADFSCSKADASAETGKWFWQA